MTATANAHWVGLRLDPLDTLFFRDGRPFQAATRAAGGLPTPQTLAGALRTALLAGSGAFDFARFARARREAREDIRPALVKAGAPAWILAARFRGPWLAKDTPLLPVPAILSQAKDGKGPLVRSRPLDPGLLPGWRHPLGDNLLPLWRSGEPRDAKPAAGFLTLDGVKAFLHGDDVPESALVKASALYDHDDRTGIVINGGTLTAETGGIYGIRLLALKRHVTFYAEVLPGPGAPPRETWFPSPLPFGGEGKYVLPTVVPAVTWPEAPAAPGLALWLLATPGPVTPGNHWPGLIEKAPLRAAASGAALAFSGWDVARNGPQPTRFAVPAGACYFTDGDFAPRDGSLCDDAELIAQGWGMALRGVWKNA